MCKFCGLSTIWVQLLHAQFRVAFVILGRQKSEAVKLSVPRAALVSSSAPTSIGLDRRAGASTSSSLTKFSRRVGVPSSSAWVCHSMLSYCNELIDLILCRRICCYFVFVFSLLRIVFLLYISAWFGNQFKLFIGDPLGVWFRSEKPILKVWKMSLNSLRIGRN